MKTGGFTFGQARLIALLLLAGLSGCANQVLGGKLDNHQNSIAVGKTTKTDIHNQLGAPDEGSNDSIHVVRSAGIRYRERHGSLHEWFWKDIEQA